MAAALMGVGSLGPYEVVIEFPVATWTPIEVIGDYDGIDTCVRVAVTQRLLAARKRPAQVGPGERKVG